ncbi:DUF485 domain-containing protein [Streptomyces minutiscleroticus]|uniref:DUF485 domain-containing protein n=1 Tax=Streptomyces minutiscleroticus TaxID=68238 RepID=UPI00331A7499
MSHDPPPPSHLPPYDPWPEHPHHAQHAQDIQHAQDAQDAQDAQPHGAASGRRVAGSQGDLRRLRSAYRWQRRVASLAALGYFTLFLVLSAYAPDLMAREAFGGLSLGLLLALCQVPVACAAIALYEHTARRGVDPVAARIRRRGGAGTGRETAR